MFERLSDKLSRYMFLLIGVGAVLEFSYLAALETFRNPETGAVISSVAENLEFWGPILEFLIGAPYVLALIAAFVLSLSTQDISALVFVICLVPTLSLAICIVAPYFTTAVVMDTVSMAAAAGVAAEGASVTALAFSMGGPTAAAAVGAYYGFLQVALTAVMMLFEALFFLSGKK